MVLDGGMLARIARRLTPEQQERLAGAWEFVVGVGLCPGGRAPPRPLGVRPWGCEEWA
jgi:hypothetical protein